MDFIKGVIFFDDRVDYGKKRNLIVWTNRVITITLLVCMGILLGVLSLMIVSKFGDIPGKDLYNSYMENEELRDLNILPAVVIMLLLYFFTGRTWIAYPVTAVLVLGFSLADYVKLLVRNDPFMATDIAVVFEALDMADSYIIDFEWRLTTSIAVLIIGTAFCAVFLRAPLRNKWARLILSTVGVIVCAVLWTDVYCDYTKYATLENEKYEEFKFDPWESRHKYISKGFLYPFIFSIQYAIPQPPAGYSNDLADDILSSYVYDAVPEDEKVNIISVMLEAYTDLTRIEELDIHEEVYAPLNRIREQAYSGMLMANTFGGGTTDSERTFLTGYSYTENFRKNVNSYVRYFTDNGYHAQGFHAGDSWFYNRENVNEYIGFDEYRFLQDVEGSNQTDEFMFNYIREEYDSRNKSVPYFGYYLTFQNHGPYHSGSTGEKAYLERGNLTDYAYNVLNNYLAGIADTTERIEQFVMSFKDDPEPVIIIMFGDHMPWMGDSNKVFTDTGINYDTGTEDGFYTNYGTMYFIWANDAAKEVLGTELIGEGEALSPCFLIPKLFELCSWGGNEFLKLSQELMEKVPVISTGSGLYVENGVITGSLSEETEEIIDKYRMAQYRLMKKRVE